MPRKRKAPPSLDRKSSPVVETSGTRAGPSRESGKRKAPVTTTEEDKQPSRRRKRRKTAKDAPVEPVGHSTSPTTSGTAGSTPPDVPEPSSVNKGKARADGWGSAALNAGTDKLNAENASLKAEVAQLKLQVAHQEQVINVHRDIVATVQGDVNCQVCLDTFKDPLTLACGHSFCRACLQDCFRNRQATPVSERADGDDGSEGGVGSEEGSSDHSQSGSEEGSDEEDEGDTSADQPDAGATDQPAADDADQQALPRRVRCPVCRDIVHVAPFPVFVVRDIAHRISHEEQPGGLLFDPVPYAMVAEAQPDNSGNLLIDANDKTWGGLFPEAVTNRMAAMQRAALRGIRDDEDGVNRCILCNWEINDGECEHCGAVYDDDNQWIRGGNVELSRSDDDRHADHTSALSEEEDDEESDADLTDFIDDNVQYDSDAGSSYRSISRHTARNPVPVVIFSDNEAANPSHASHASSQESEGSEAEAETGTANSKRAKPSGSRGRVIVSDSSSGEEGEENAEQDANQDVNDHGSQHSDSQHSSDDSEESDASSEVDTDDPEDDKPKHRRRTQAREEAPRSRFPRKKNGGPRGHASLDSDIRPRLGSHDSQTDVDDSDSDSETSTARSQVANSVQPQVDTDADSTDASEESDESDSDSGSSSSHVTVIVAPSHRHKAKSSSGSVARGIRTAPRPKAVVIDHTDDESA